MEKNKVRTFSKRSRSKWGNEDPKDDMPEFNHLIVGLLQRLAKSAERIVEAIHPAYEEEKNNTVKRRQWKRKWNSNVSSAEGYLCDIGLDDFSEGVFDDLASSLILSLPYSLPWQLSAFLDETHPADIKWESVIKWLDDSHKEEVSKAIKEMLAQEEPV